MTYIIRKTDGTTLGTILDGTIDDRNATSLQLVGRNYSGYGQIMTDNLVSMLENWAFSTPPLNPLAGQLWYDTSDLRLKVFNGTTFKVISGSTSQATAPSTTTAGDFWWDSVNKQLYVYDGTTPYSAAGWILIGPGRDNTGAIWEQITDTLSIDHTVVSVKISGTRVAIISNDSEWTPLVPISGFTTIKPGYNVASPGIFNGTANNSIRLNSLESSSFLRSDIDSTTTGMLTIENNNGLKIGLNSNVSITTATNGDAVFYNLGPDRNTIFKAGTSSGVTTLLTLSSSQNSASVNKLNVTSSQDSTSSSTGALVVSGGVGIAGRLNVADQANFAGKVIAPTAPAGTANTWVATTEFVLNNSGFLTNKIYAGGSAGVATTYIDVNDTGIGNARIVIDGVTVATAGASGFSLSNGATAVTQPDTYNGTGNSRVATTQFVKTAAQWWGGSKKFVSSSAPTPGVNDIGSVDGDFWFQYTP